MEPGAGGGAVQRSPVAEGGARGTGVEPWGRGWSPGNRDGAAPWSPGTGVEPAAAARTTATQARFSRERPAAAAWAPGSALVYNLPPGKSAGPSRAGRWRDQKGLCCTGRGGRVCFVGWIWVPSPREGRLVPNRPAPGLPLSRGGWNLGGGGGGGSPHFLPRPGRPLLPASPPKLPASLLHPRRPCSGPESRQEAGRSLRGEKGPREGKEEVAAATPCKKFREPRGHHPHPLFGSEPIQPPRVPPQVHPELTAGRPAEPDNQKQNEEAKTALGVTHLDPSFARVRGCQVRTWDPLLLARSCGVDLRRLWADCLGGPSADRPRPGFRLEALRLSLSWALLLGSGGGLVGPSCSVSPALQPYSALT